MKYTFEVLGVSPILHFFNHQQEIIQKLPEPGVEYVGSYRCTLDSFIQSIETVPPQRGWDLDQVVETVVNFWMNNSEKIQLWKRRLEDAGNENLIVARIADLKALRTTFESLIRD
ncbi:hypothetical protein NDA01_03090 [Trichocoleus desertorum AS-A10]|uniref:hypothetical protein n=1 Tax=Trichocoleus desertorum TaxID=1481672 RepID=UPI0032993E20